MLEAIPQLRSLSLASFIITPGGASGLRSALPQLLELHLPRCEVIEGAGTDEGLAAVAENLQVRTREVQVQG